MYCYSTRTRLGRRFGSRGGKKHEKPGHLSPSQQVRHGPRRRKLLLSFSVSVGAVAVTAADSGHASNR